MTAPDQHCKQRDVVHLTASEINFRITQPTVALICMPGIHGDIVDFQRSISCRRAHSRQPLATHEIAVRTERIGAPRLALDPDVVLPAGECTSCCYRWHLWPWIREDGLQAHNLEADAWRLAWPGFCRHVLASTQKLMLCHDKGWRFYFMQYNGYRMMALPCIYPRVFLRRMYTQCSSHGDVRGCWPCQALTLTE